MKRIAKVLLRYSHPWVTRARLVSDIRALGVRPGGMLLVHSSLSALGCVVGGRRAVIKALLDVVGPEGTLVFPTHSWEQMEAGCRVFDASTTPSCVGAITEAFRVMPGVVRSRHPTHSVAALGPRARWLIEGHEHCPTPCGAGTPYDKLLCADGQILLLGTNLDKNTVFHTLEALAGVPYLMHERPDDFQIIDGAGGAIEMQVYRHRAGNVRRMAAMEGQLLLHRIITCGLIGPAPSVLVAGMAFRSFMLAALERDPNLLLANCEAAVIRTAQAAVQSQTNAIDARFCSAEV